MGKAFRLISSVMALAIVVSVSGCSIFGVGNDPRKGKGVNQADGIKQEGLNVDFTMTPVDPIGTIPTASDPTDPTDPAVPTDLTVAPAGNVSVPDKNDYTNEVEAWLALCSAIVGNDLKTAEAMINEYFGIFLVVSETNDSSYDTRFYDVNITVDDVVFDNLYISANKDSGKVFQVNISFYRDDENPGLQAYKDFYNKIVDRYGVPETDMDEDEDFLYSFYALDNGCNCNINVYYVPGYSSFTFDFNDYSLIY